jgi:thioesterase domain-containing protein/acyl carrier protein
MTASQGVDDASESPEHASAELQFPCSASQQRCWFIQALNPDSTVLNIALRWEIKGQFSAATIEQAFQTIVDRHEILRTTFVVEDGVPMQKVAERHSFRLSIVDLTFRPEAERLDQAIALGVLEAHKPFDLTKLPLLRVTLLRLSADHAVLLVTVHQIAFDGWSIRNLAHEFGVIAAALDANRPHGLPELLLQYGDYCLWQKEYFASAGFEIENAYWKNRLAGAPYFEISPDRERPSQLGNGGEILAIMMPAALADRLDETARKHNVTLFSFGCAVTAAMLHRYSGCADVIFGTQIAGRDDPDLENMIGVFLNNLVLRFDASGDPTFETFLARVNGVIQDAVIHQRMPFHRLVEVLNPPRDPKRTPLICIDFNVLRDVMDHKTYGTFELMGQPSLSAGSLYDLHFFLVHWPSGWRLAVEYNTDLYERRTAEGMLEFLMSAFQIAIFNPNAKLSQLVPPVRERIAPLPPGGALAKTAPPQPAPSTAFGKKPNKTETRMIEVWREILQVSDVGPASNFFELGGHSLLAMRLVAKVARVFDVKINVMTLFQAPTVRELAARVAATETVLEPWNIVQIQPLGEKTPIIAINNTMIYYNLARIIGTDRRFLGVQLYDPSNPGQLPSRGLEDIASDYVRLIREAQPRGPYILLGLCVAGVLAYEAARQLRQSGETVALVVMADTWVPGYLKRLPFGRRVLFRLRYALHVLNHRLALIRRGKLPIAEALASYRLVRGSKILNLLSALHVIGEPSNLGKEDWANRWFLPALEEARDNYLAPESTGDVVILQSEEMVTNFADPKMGWPPLVNGQLQLYPIPGWHTDMFQDEGAAMIARHLRPLLDRVDTERDRAVTAGASPV